MPASVMLELWHAGGKNAIVKLTGHSLIMTYAVKDMPGMNIHISNKLRVMLTELQGKRHRVKRRYLNLCWKLNPESRRTVSAHIR